MRGLGLLVALSLAGCAEMQEATGVATQQDLLQLRQEMMAAQSAQRGKGEADSISAQVDKRVREQTSEHDRQVATLTRQIDSLNDTVTTLSGRVDDLTTKLDTVNRQLRGAVAPGTGPAATAPRPAAGASGAPAGGTTPGASTATPTAPAPGPVAAVPPRPTTGALQPQDIYQAAYIDFSKGSYALAIAGFREFLRRYPDHELAGSAQYWIGEAYLALARGFSDASQGDKASESLEQAVQEFKKVQANYPRADKVPTALYKEALALIDLKQPALAQARLQYLVDNFPRAEETSLARERLTTLKNTPR
ncbi:MAG TPA: outer membrane protein assembly factor BamD [Methylomirabilota bacterium]|nr:outer membrane protein assembly factor BamD [Methylomirabilota bacterium]